jgi:hypothetical protein
METVLVTALALTFWLHPALARATRYWHHPLPACIQISQRRLPDDDVADATMGDCRIFYAKGHRWRWPVFCQATIHEVGHLLGHPHSRDRHNVMYPETSPENRPVICKRVRY